MLRKLDRYGFRNDVNDFLNSYLSDRKMVTGKKRTVKKHIGKKRIGKKEHMYIYIYIYIYKCMGKKRTRKEAHTEKSAHGKKRTRINPF